MAGISTALSLQDRFTQTMQKQIAAVERMIDRMQALGSISNSLNPGKGLKQVSQKAEDFKNELNEINPSPVEQGIARWGNPIATASKALDFMKKSFQTVSSVMSGVDDFTMIGARLNLINDGLQTTKQLQQMVYQSAQRSRGAYDETASAVAKLGLLAKDSFGSNQEIVQFTELMNKAFTVSGASQEEKSSGMSQLTQAMASGKLQGDEFSSIMESAPMLAEAIANFTGKSTGELKEMSAEGAITASVIKNALFAASDGINDKFAQMPATFGSVMNFLKNYTLQAFQPMMESINNAINSPQLEIFVQNVANAISTGVGYIQQFVSFVSKNWGQIKALAIGLGIAIGSVVAVTKALQLATLVMKGADIAAAIAKTVLNMTTTKQTLGTVEATAAQWGLNTAMLASPVMWIIMAIGVLAGAIYGMVSAANSAAENTWAEKWKKDLEDVNKTIDETAKSEIANAEKARMLYQEYERLASYTKNTSTELDRMKTIASELNGIIPNLNAVWDEQTRRINTASGSLAALVDNYYEYMYAQAMLKAYQSKFDALAEAIVTAQDTITESKRIMDENKDKPWHKNDLFGSYTDAGKAYFDAINKKNQANYVIIDSQKTMEGYIDQIAEQQKIIDAFGGEFTVENGTDDPVPVSGDVSVADEDLKMLRDIAEARFVQNFVTLTPQVSMRVGNINNNVDVEEVTSVLERRLENEFAVAAEGVYA